MFFNRAAVPRVDHRDANAARHRRCRRCSSGSARARLLPGRATGRSRSSRRRSPAVCLRQRLCVGGMIRMPVSNPRIASSAASGRFHAARTARVVLEPGIDEQPAGRRASGNEMCRARARSRPDGLQPCGECGGDHRSGSLPETPCYHRDPPCHEPNRPSVAPLRIIRARDISPGLAARAQARLAEGARAGLAELPPAQGPDEGAAAQHGLRRGALPEHRRVLEPRHGDVHDSRRRLHARLRLLRGAARHADRARRRRAGTRRPCDRDDGRCSTSSSRRSIATTSPMAAPASSPRRSGPSARRVPSAASRC